MTYQEIKEAFAAECTELDGKGRVVVKGTPMEIIDWIAKKFANPNEKQACEHHYVPIDSYNQNGRFICTECKIEL